MTATQPEPELVVCAENANVRRRALLDNQDTATRWLTSTEASILLGSPSDNGSVYANDLRRKGVLLGVWSMAERGYRFPPWQFRYGAGKTTPIPEVAEILKLLRDHGGVSDGGRRTSGWNEVEWFMTPHVDLDGTTPIERLADHPDQVLRAAKSEFLENADAAW